MLSIVRGRPEYQAQMYNVANMNRRAAGRTVEVEKRIR
jgi:hypothetical protein